MNSPDGAALAQLSPSVAKSTSAPSNIAPSPAVVVLVLHGGGADSTARTGWRNPAVLRLWPVARSIARTLPDSAVYLLRFSVRGWNGDGNDAIRDARWALAELRRAHPAVPIVVVGHSMGGRAAAQIGGDDGIAGLVLLAPWTPSGDPAAQLAGVPVTVIQGGRDRVIPESTTRPWMSRAELAGARLRRTLLPWAGHTMLRRFWVWHRLAADGVRSVLADSTVVAQDQSISE